MGKTRRPWPPPEPDAFGFFGSTIGGGLLFFTGAGLHATYKAHASVLATLLLALVVTAHTTFVVYCLSRVLKLPRHTWVVGFLSIVPGILALRGAHLHAVRADTYAALWPVCAGTPVASAGSVDRARGHAALFLLTGQPWEPRPAWVPSDVSSTALVGCVRACGTEVRVARTAEVIGCARTEGDLALLIEPVER
ncbi:MAG: hypothetical protein SFX73_39920 [Kofleriaceae bacterium]|nr:hypothetical protein [Kofleriaceae bacterium]